MTKWWDELTPDDFVSSVYEIDLDELWHAGRRLVLTDLDNTLVPWNDPDAPTALLAWMERVKRSGFELCIISNNEGPRVSAFSAATGIAAVGAARKPRPDAFIAAMRRFGRAPEETVMVGDQLFTDVRGANRAGIYSILVLPIDRREWWATKIVRQAERFVMWRLLRSKRIVHPQS